MQISTSKARPHRIELKVASWIFESAFFEQNNFKASVSDFRPLASSLGLARTSLAPSLVLARTSLASSLVLARSPLEFTVKMQRFCIQVRCNTVKMQRFSLVLARSPLACSLVLARSPLAYICKIPAVLLVHQQYKARGGNTHRYLKK